MSMKTSCRLITGSLGVTGNMTIDYAGSAYTRACDPQAKLNFRILFHGAVVLLFLMNPAAHAEKRALWDFTLTKGKGVEVCDAYLKRLTSTEHKEYPFCDRPEDDSVEGFARLNRVPLSAEEVYALVDRIYGFTHSLNQNFWTQQREGRRESTFPESEQSLTRKTIEGSLGHSIRVWRYEPSVDIDNDGVPDKDLVVWHGYGAGGGLYHCGSIKYRYPERQGQIIYAIDYRMKVDEARTRELFGHLLWGYPAMKNGEQIGFYPQFRPIGNKLSVFQYRGEYYFDTFFDTWGDFEGRRREYKYIADTLSVFQRKGGMTKQVCEYRWHNPDHP